MDDHMWEMIMDYAECELIPRFQEEYRAVRRIESCPSNKEIEDLCKLLNVVSTWSGHARVTPGSFLM